MTTVHRSAALAGAALILAVSVGGCATDTQLASSPATGGDSTGTSTASTAPPVTPRPRTLPSNQVAIDGEQVARSAAATLAATAFMRAFARPDLTEEAWWARVAPLLTESGRHAALGTDPARIPVTEVTGTAEVLPGAETGARTVRVPTDIGDYLLFLLYEPGSGRWLVQTYQPPPDTK